VDVLPVLVSPSNTGSFQAMQHATRSSKHTAGQVKEKRDPLVAVNNRNMFITAAVQQCFALRSSTEQKVIFKKELQLRKLAQRTAQADYKKSE
jgi:hypothetical protein